MGVQVSRSFYSQVQEEVLYGELRRHLGEVFRTLAQHKESRIEEGHLMADHVHMMIVIPPKYAVSQVVGYIKGKSAIHLARVYGERKRNFVGQHFWARGYFVSTVGGTSRSSETTSGTKRRKTRDSNSLGCGDEPPPNRWHQE